MAQEAISKLLTRHIAADLPAIQQRVEAGINAIRKGLQSAPAPGKASRSMYLMRQSAGC